MNNLIERLHASFFFFILTAPDRFLKIGSYLPSALLVSVAMMFGGLKAWSDAFLPIARDTKHIQPKTREVLSVLIIMAYTHILGALLFWFLTSNWYLNKSHVRPFMIVFGLMSTIPQVVSATTFAAVAFSVVPIARQFPDSNASPLALSLKSFNLCMASTVVSITAMLNFSLASTLAVLLGIPLSISSPSKPAASLMKRAIKTVLYAVLALGWLFLTNEVEQALWNWNFLSVWFAPFVCIVYMPLVLQAGLVCLL